MATSELLMWIYNILFAMLINIQFFDVPDYGVDKYDIGSGFGHFGIAVEDVSSPILYNHAADSSRIIQYLLHLILEQSRTAMKHLIPFILLSLLLSEFAIF